MKTFGNYEGTLAEISVSGQHTTRKIYEFKAQRTNLIFKNRERKINQCLDCLRWRVGNQYNLLKLDKQEVETFGTQSNISQIL